MTFRGGWIRNAVIGLSGLVIVLLLAAIIAVQTDWFRNYVRKTIVSSVEEDIGGRAEVGEFHFDPGRVHATVQRLVIHGREPVGAAPFVSVARVEIYLRFFTSLKRLYEISYLGLDKPEITIGILPDGSTNIPVPRKKTTSDKSALESIMDLAIGRVALHHGEIAVASMRQPLNLNARNLRAQMDYSFVSRSYTGQLAMEPLYALNGRDTPVNFKVILPVTIASDRVELRDAAISTPLSRILLTGTFEDMKNPKISGRINARIATADLVNAGNLPQLKPYESQISMLDLAGKASVSNNAIQVDSMHAQLGGSSVEASGTLRDPNGNGALDFKADLSIDELAQIAGISGRPSGNILLNGKAKLGPASSANTGANTEYSVDGDVHARNVSIHQSGIRLANVDAASSFHADSHNLSLSGLRLRALGGEFTGDVALADFDVYKVNGNLRDLNIGTVLRAMGESLPYDGTVSGKVDAEGKVKTGIRGVTANARLAIAPGRGKVALAGRVNAHYDGQADNLSVENSYLALPHSRLTLAGDIGKRLDVSFTSEDLTDVLAALPGTSQEPPIVTLDKTKGGTASVTAAVTGKLTAPRVTGEVSVSNFSVGEREFSSLRADVSATSSQARVSNGVLSRGLMQAQLAGTAGLRNWSPAPALPVALDATVRNADLADAMALAGCPATGYSGPLTATAQLTGTGGNPRGTVNVQVGRGEVYGEPINGIQMQANFADRQITIPNGYVDAVAGRITFAADYQHAADSLASGHLHAHVQSDQLDLARSAVVQAQQKNSGGVMRLNATVEATVSPGDPRSGSPSLMVDSVNGDASGRGLSVQGVNYGDFTATAKTTARNVTYSLTSNFAGASIRANGVTQLQTGYPTQGTANVANLPVERALAVAGHSDIPARGIVTGTVGFNGTLDSPQGNAQFELTRATIYGENIDRARVQVTYLPQSVDVTQFEVTSGPSHIALTARYDHPAGDLRRGTVRFAIGDSHVDLARVKTVQDYRPGLSGAADFRMSGVAAMEQATAAGGSPQISVNSLDANMSANGISAGNRNFGDLKLTANTDGGNRVRFVLDSNLASSNIHADGNAVLAGDYQVDAKLTFSRVAWTNIASLLGRGDGTAPSFEATTEGQATIAGPLRNMAQLNGSLSVTRLNLTTIPRAGSVATRNGSITIENQGPIQLALDHGVAKIQTAHLAGPQTDLQATGSISLADSSLNLNLNGHADLGLVQRFDHDVLSSGNATLAATVRGSTSQPVVNGQLSLQGISFAYADLPLGISNGNGVVAFNGQTVQIRSLTADSGGGKIAVTGNATISPDLRFALRATASNVRFRAQQGLNVTSDADLRVTGTTAASRVSGDITINRVTYASQSDLGSILTRAAPPVQAPVTPSPILDNMKLDVRIRNASGMTVESPQLGILTAAANLHVAGTANEPGVVGRVTLGEGKVTFFGGTYTVSTGTIAFYNPVRIEPILDVSLETQARGVAVTLQVTGPVDNMKLSYTSDPPLQFEEIIALLAGGKTPVSDPTLLANQPPQPQQGVQQMGESAILGQAVANPVANQLKRVFGVTSLKIDPSFTTGSDLPTAQLAMQQQITKNLTFTYATAMDNPNSTLVRMEWAFNPQWTAVATRDQNGRFSMNFFYKKSFH